MLYAAITNQYFSYLFKLEKRNNKYFWVNTIVFNKSGSEEILIRKEDVACYYSIQREDSEILEEPRSFLTPFKDEDLDERNLSS